MGGKIFCNCGGIPKYQNPTRPCFLKLRAYFPKLLSPISGLWDLLKSDVET